MSRDFKIDTKKLRQYENDLKVLNRRGIPYAVSNTLNNAAFDAREEWQAEVRNKMVTRNQFTERSIRVDRSSPKTLESVVGSSAPYMEHQEEGATIQGQGGAKAVPTDSARVGKSHNRLVSRPNKMSKIALGPRRGRSQKQRNAIQISEAKRKGRRYVFLETGPRRGIFRLRGGKRTTKLELVQTLSHRSVTIPRNPTMKVAVHRAAKKMPMNYVKHLRSQLQLAKTWKR